jgi:hypothetical protein
MYLLILYVDGTTFTSEPFDTFEEAMAEQARLTPTLAPLPHDLYCFEIVS